MNKIVLLLLLLKATYALSQEDYNDRVFELAMDGWIQVYDTLGTPIVLADFNRRYFRVDTAIYDLWSRPKFENIVYHKGFDGTAVFPKPSFDTLHNRFRPGSILFRHIRRDPDGNELGRDNAFLFFPGAKMRSPALVKRELKREMNRLRGPQAHFKKLICAENQPPWRNAEIWLPDRSLRLDSCHKLYTLRLHRDFTFEQSYNGQLECASAEMARYIDVNVEGPYDELLEYAEKVQLHYLTLKQGLWAIRDENLVLLTAYGREIIRFELFFPDETGRTMILKNGDFRVQLVR